MRNSFTEDQKRKAVRESNTGRPANEICEELHILPSQLKQWKERFSEQNGHSNGDGIQIMLKDLRDENKELKDENALLRKMYLEKSLEVSRLEEGLQKKR